MKRREDLREEELFGSETVMVFPTDTVYGLGGNALEKSVTDRIYRIKRRSREKPLTLHLFSTEKIEEYTVELEPFQEKLINDLLPGPYTLVLPAASTAPDISVSQERKVGLRVPDCASFMELEEKVSYPLVGTSVNRSGEPPLQDFDEIVEKLGGLVDLFIEGDEEPSGKSSTVLDATYDPPRTLRGPYPREE